MAPLRCALLDGLAHAVGAHSVHAFLEDLLTDFDVCVVEQPLEHVLCGVIRYLLLKLSILEIYELVTRRVQIGINFFG